MNDKEFHEAMMEAAKMQEVIVWDRLVPREKPKCDSIFVMVCGGKLKIPAIGYWDEEYKGVCDFHSGSVFQAEYWAELPKGPDRYDEKT